MVRKVVLYLTLFSTMLLATTQNDGMRIQDFRLPSQKIFGLWFSAGLDRYYYGDDIGYYADIRPYFRLLSDTTEIDLLFGVRGDHRYLSGIDCYSNAEIRHYPFSLPLFLHGKLNFRVYTYSPDWEPNLRSDVEIGSGMGHLREGQHVAMALHVNEILLKDGIIDKGLTRETILLVAQLLSKEDFFRFQYDRHLKYFFQEIEEVLGSDPACNKPIPAFTWFKIYSVLQATPRYRWPVEYGYWQRMFGSRFSIDMIADNINNDARTNRYTKLEFPLFYSYYYIPGIRVKYEYGKPIDLRRQMTFNTSYIAAWYDDALFHRVDIQARYGYGIIDFILLEGIVSLYYNHIVPQGANSQSTYGIRPELEFSYYIENGVDIGVDGGCDFRKQENLLYSSGFEYTANWFIEFYTRWRVF
ncbi:MAG: hypothetical protein OEV79_12600 [candidate division WOR-3 bacterium]|nr:hypothetical protein [candidate division WOR-3 bacterium]